ncbi:MAG: hypothetical protein V7644_1480, partial [Actinomycetota bacterium]
MLSESCKDLRIEGASLALAAVAVALIAAGAVSARAHR